MAISGDIGESHDVCHYLRKIEEIIEKPIYFVLGNHDFYRGSIAQVRRMLTGLSEDSKYLNYLTINGRRGIDAENRYCRPRWLVRWAAG